MSLRLLSFLAIILLASFVQAAPALAGPAGWRPQLQLSLALPLPGPVAYAPPPAPPPPAVHLHAAAPPVVYAAPPAAYPVPSPPPPAQQWVWVKGGFVVQSCGTRAWAPAHWELATVAPVQHAYGPSQRHRHGPHQGQQHYRFHQKHHSDGPSYARAAYPQHDRRWRH